MQHVLLSLFLPIVTTRLLLDTKRVPPDLLLKNKHAHNSAVSS